MLRDSGTVLFAAGDDKPPAAAYRNTDLLALADIYPCFRGQSIGYQVKGWENPKILHAHPERRVATAVRWTGLP